MTTSGLSAGLAFLPTWLTETANSVTVDSLLCGWVKANGWRSAGLAWPCENPSLVIMARAEASDRPPYTPAEFTEVSKSLLGGSSTIIWQVPSSAGRLYTMFSPPGRPSGAIWADRGPSEPWTELDRSYLKLSAKIMERSQTIAQVVGPMVDHDRLQTRLADASIIAGRMAHDFDNILTGIIGFADLTLPMVPVGSQQAKFIGEIGKVGQRGIQFTQQLHQLSRSAQVKPLPTAVGTAIAKEETRLRSMMQLSTTIITQASSSLPPVAMESMPLQNVIGHMLQNAIEAVPANGPIVVNARAVELNSIDIQGYLGHVAPGAHIEITVQDHGPGIKPDHQTKLFAEPFFTTKVRHRGLGLCIAYRTLFAHRGGIRIDSSTQSPTGTTVRVVIPLAAARPAVVNNPAQFQQVFSPSVKG
jgi:signal transduction histidine kinase